MSTDFAASLRDEPRSDEYEGDVDAVLHAQHAESDLLRHFAHRLGSAATAERAHLEHPRLRDAVLHLRAQTDMDAPEWWDAYRALMDVADSIAGAS